VVHLGFMVNHYMKRMTKIKIETITQAMIEIKKLQRVCQKYRKENEALKKEIRTLNEMPDFLKGFRGKR